MVVQSFLYLLVPLNRTELTRVNYYEFLKSSTTPCRKKSPAPVNGLTLDEDEAGAFLENLLEGCLNAKF